MNHIVKPFRPYFNTPLDPHRTRGMIAYYDATTQQGGGYLADRVGNRHGVFNSSVSWSNGNSVSTSGTNTRIVAPCEYLLFPFAVLGEISLSAFNNNLVFLGVPGPLLSDSTRRCCWSRTKDARITFSGNGIAANGFGLAGSDFVVNRFYHIVINYLSSTEIEIYKNGVKSQPISTNDYWRHMSGNISIGARYDGTAWDTTYAGSCRFQQLAIFNRALTRGEILAHYQDPYYFYERPKIYGFILSSSGSSLPAIINNYRQQGVM